MSDILLTFTHRVANVLTDATSVVLSDPTGTFGVKRDDTGAMVVAAGTVMPRLEAGTYQYTFAAPAAGLTYTWYAEWVYGGATYRAEFTLVAGGSWPVTVAEAKVQLRVDSDLTVDDTLLEGLIGTATEWCQDYQTRKYLTQTCVDYLDSWPALPGRHGRWWSSSGALRPRWSPLVLVASIQYLDTGGTWQTLAPGRYQVDAARNPGRILPAYNCSWPDLRGDPNGIILTYTAGYGTAANVPHGIRSAILLLVAHLYAHREASAESSLSEIPFGVTSLLGMNRVHHV